MIYEIGIGTKVRIKDTTDPTGCSRRDSGPAAPRGAIGEVAEESDLTVRVRFPGTEFYPYFYGKDEIEVVSMSNPPGEIQIGSLWRYVGHERDLTDGSLDRVTDVRDGMVYAQEVEGCADGEGGRFTPEPWQWDREWFLALFRLEENPTPEAVSNHPGDLKPRTGKAPLHLIPWSVVPAGFRPEDMESAAAEVGRWPDGDTYSPDDPETLTYADALLASLLGDCGIEAMAEAFQYGATKYRRDNWRTFTWDAAAEDCYWAAICRHLNADWNRTEARAEDSGVLHKGHAAAGCAIWIWHERRRKAGLAPWAQAADGSGVRP